MQPLAVLTGDIVRSQRLATSDLDRVFAAMSQHAMALGRSTAQGAHFTRARGDGWQMVAAPSYALRAVFVMRAAVRACGKGFETRLAVSVGDGNVPGNSLAGADGPAFVASGQALDAMRKVRRVASASVPVAIASALPLAEAVSARWTPRQAEIALMALALPELPRPDMARALDLSQQAFQKHWSAAALVAVQDACCVAESLPA